MRFNSGSGLGDVLVADVRLLSVELNAVPALLVLLKDLDHVAMAELTQNVGRGGGIRGGTDVEGRGGDEHELTAVGAHGLAQGLSVSQTAGYAGTEKGRSKSCLISETI